MVANAQPAKVNLRRADTFKPGHRDIWIRLDDQWWPGQISAWLRLDGRWIVTATHYRPGMADQVGNYWYDRGSIAPRTGDESPSD